MGLFLSIAPGFKPKFEKLSPVFKIYRDILNNEIWVTKWTYETHIGQGLTPEAQKLIRKRIPVILKTLLKCPPSI
jgi:hypothetical protein